MSFDDVHVLERRIQTVHSHVVDFRRRNHPRWEVVAGGSNARISYDAEQLQSRSRKESAGELGLDYLTPSGNNIGLVARRVAGRYASSVDLALLPFADDFEQGELHLRGTWNATGKSRRSSTAAMCRAVIRFSAQGIFAAPLRGSI